MKTPDYKNSVVLRWSDNDGVWVAQCLEFPWLVCDSGTAEQAMQELNDAVRTCLEFAEECNGTIPSPVTWKPGKVELK